MHMSNVMCVYRDMTHSCGGATVSRLLKMIGLFCRISSLLWGSLAKETYHFKEPTNRSHPICATGLMHIQLQVSCRKSNDRALNHFAQKSPIITSNFACAYRAYAYTVAGLLPQKS